MNSGTVNSGSDTTRPSRLCRPGSSSRRGIRRAGRRPGSARSARVTGAPISRHSGEIIVSTMCCTMCTLNSPMP